MGVEPADLAPSQREDAADDEFRHPLRMGFGIGQRQRRSPGATHHLPALDFQVLAEHLHVGDQVPCGVLCQLRMRRRLAAAALVEQDDAIGRRIMCLAQEGRDAAARPAMQHHGGLALRVSAFLEMEFMEWRDTQPAAVEGWEVGIECVAVHHLIRDPAI